MNQETIQHSEQKKPCVNCGAELLYKPGSSEIKCDYCGYEETIEETDSVFEELELYPYLDKMGAQSHTEEITMTEIRSNVYMIYWKEKSGNRIVHIEDFEKEIAYTNISMPDKDGTFYHFKGPLTLIK